MTVDNTDSEPRARDQCQRFHNRDAYSHFAGTALLVIAQHHRNFTDAHAHFPDLKKDLGHAGKAPLLDEIVPPGLKGFLDNLGPVGTEATGIVAYPTNRQYQLKE